MTENSHGKARGLNEPISAKNAEDIEIKLEISENDVKTDVRPGTGMIEPAIINQTEKLNLNFVGNPNDSPSPNKNQESPQNKSDLSPNTQNSSPSRNRPERYVSKIDVTEGYDKPDHKKFKERMNQLHARNNQDEPYSCCDAICKVTTGWYCLCGTSKKSEVDKFGIGVVLYFRFIKYLACFFLIASILSIPSLYFAIESSQQFSNESLKNYKGGLYFTTMGSIARGVSGCYLAKISETVSLSCVRGTLGPLSTFKYGRVIEEEAITCDYFSTYSWDTNCNTVSATNSLETQYNENCSGQSACSITVDSDFFDFSSEECSNWEASSNRGYYFQNFCQDINLQLPDGTAIKKTTVGWIIVSLDAAISVIYLIFLILLRFFENKTIKRVLGNIDPVETYTLEVRSLPKMTSQELRARLWSHFSSVEINGKKTELQIVDVQLAESSGILRLNEQLGALKEKKVRLYRAFYKKWSASKTSPLISVEYEDLHKIAKDNGGKALSDFKKVQRVKKTQDDIQAKIEKARTVKKGQAVAAFVTFEDQTQRDVAFSYFQSSVFQRFWYSVFPCFYKKDPNILEKSYLHVTDAPAPSNITWSNMDAGKFEKFMRRLSSWVITLALWIASFAFMAYVRNQQKILAQNVRPTKDCSADVNPSRSSVIDDINAGVNSLGLLECYCRYNISRAFKDSICKSWILDKIESNALPFIIVIAIIFINYILQYVFRFLSSFEKHRSSTSESVSRILKIFVAQGLNTGVIILIVNIKFGNNPIPKIFGGDYDDVTPQWYISVATTILITMIINVVSLPIINTVFRIISSCLRCLDRGCTLDYSKTKKKTQEQWENLYTGPEFLIEFRYAQILTIVFVCLLYSSGIPLLFISTLVNLGILYMMDKYYLLKICRLPRDFDKKMQTMVRRTMFIAILLHLGNAVWTYGFVEIFGDSDPLKTVADYFNKFLTKQTPGIFSRLVQRATLQVTFSLTILFLFVLVIILIRVLFYGSFQKVKQICLRKRGKRTEVDERYKDKNPYYGKIKLDDLQTEQKYLEKEMNSAKNQELSKLLEKRLERVEKEINSRQDVKEYTRDKFQGLFSYSVKHNPKHRRVFEAKGLQSIGSGKTIQNV